VTFIPKAASIVDSVIRTCLGSTPCSLPLIFRLFHPRRGLPYPVNTPFILPTNDLGSPPFSGVCVDSTHHDELPRVQLCLDCPFLGPFRTCGVPPPACRGWLHQPRRRTRTLAGTRLREESRSGRQGYRLTITSGGRARRGSEMP
jgi:hypothetical protein